MAERKNPFGNFHGPIPEGANIHFVTKVFDCELTIVKVADDTFDVYNNGRLTQPDHNYEGVIAYLSYVYHNNPKNPEIIKMREEFRAKKAKKDLESAAGRFIGLSNAEVSDGQFSSDGA